MGHKVKPAAGDSATLSIRVWAKSGLKLPEDLSEAFESHVSHVADMCAQGYTSGEIVAEEFSGWWEIKNDV